MPAAASNAQLAFVWRSCECATALAVSPKEPRHARLRRARRAALVVVLLCTVQGYRTAERTLSSGVRPCCDVPAAASNTQQAFAWRARERSIALAVYQEEKQHACLRRARAVLRWL